MTRLCENSGNTTHGSGWIVQGQPTQGHARDSRFFLSLPSRREGREIDNKKQAAARFLCRPSLNNPPTAVGGIPGVFTQPQGRGVLMEEQAVSGSRPTRVARARLQPPNLKTLSIIETDC